MFRINQSIVHKMQVTCIHVCPLNNFYCLYFQFFFDPFWILAWLFSCVELNTEQYGSILYNFHVQIRTITQVHMFGETFIVSLYISRWWLCEKSLVSLVSSCFISFSPIHHLFSVMRLFVIYFEPLNHLPSLLCCSLPSNFLKTHLNSIIDVK